VRVPLKTETVTERQKLTKNSQRAIDFEISKSAKYKEKEKEKATAQYLHVHASP